MRERRTLGSHWPNLRQGLKGNGNAIILLLALAATIAIFARLSEHFRNPDNVVAMLFSLAALGFVCLGQTLLLISGMFDISVGSVVGFSGILLARILHIGGIGSPFQTVLAIFFVMAVCGFIGFINGVVVSTIRINALIATLSMLWILLGLSLVISGGIDIVIKNGFVIRFGTQRLAGFVPVTFILLVILYVVFFLLLKYSVFGRRIYIVGNNERAASYAGIPVENVRISLFTITAVLSGLAGIMLSAKLTSAQSVYGEGYPIESVAICLLGGTVLSGGKGGVMGTFIALVFLTVLQNGLDHCGLPFYVTNIVTGIMLILAIFLSNVVDRPKKQQRG